MYARLTQLEIDTMRIDIAAAVELYHREVLDEVRSQPGYAGVLVLSNDEGMGAVVTFWDSEEAAEAHGDTGFYPDVLERYVTLFRSAPGRTRYRVSYAELPTVPADAT
jgi:hypothetical protein